MEFEEYGCYDAVSLAGLVKEGEASAGELLEDAISHAEAVNPSLNTFVRPIYREARDRTGEELSGPFPGVPFLIKDLGHDYAGLPTSAGNSMLATPPVPEHSAIVRSWLEAGLVIFCPTVRSAALMEGFETSSPVLESTLAGTVWRISGSSRPSYSIQSTTKKKPRRSSCSTVPSSKKEPLWYRG